MVYDVLKRKKLQYVVFIRTVLNAFKNDDAFFAYV